MSARELFGQSALKQINLNQSEGQDSSKKMRVSPRNKSRARRHIEINNCGRLVIGIGVVHGLFGERVRCRPNGASPATVVGWSGGGVIALDLAASDPDRVAALVLAEPAVHLLTHPTLAALGMAVRSGFQRYVRRDATSAALT